MRRFQIRVGALVAFSLLVIVGFGSVGQIGVVLGGASDGFTDVQQPKHRGPSNTETAFDNCPGVENADQKNADGNFVANSPAYNYDSTWPDTDPFGDACDPDADNDGI